MRRGFALPLALVIIIVSTVILSSVLVRFSGQRLLVQKQLDAYQDHHISRGVREAVDAWIGAAVSGATSVPSVPAQGAEPPKTIEDYLEADGRAFTLQVGESAPVTIFLFEAQGGLLSDFSGLSSQELQAAAGALATLPEVVTGNVDPKFLTRREGPLAVSVRSASPDVLDAVTRAVLGPTKGREFLQELLRARSEPRFDATKLTEVYTRTNTTGEEATVLQSMLTATPSLWMVVAEMDGSDGQLVRYRGLTTVRSSAGRARAASNRPGQFLTWERVYDVTQPRFLRWQDGGLPQVGQTSAFGGGEAQPSPMTPIPSTRW